MYVHAYAYMCVGVYVCAYTYVREKVKKVSKKFGNVNYFSYICSMKLQLRKLTERSPRQTTLQEVFRRIQSPTAEEFRIYSFLRNCEDRESLLFKETKKQLELVFWNTIFTDQGTSSDCVLATTGFLYFDIDTPITNTDILKQNPYVYAFWKSCTGKGYGGLIRVVNLPKEVSSTLYRNIMTQVGIAEMVDPSCSNINRGNFISYDPNIRNNIRSNSTVVDVSKLVDAEYDFLQKSPKSKVKAILKPEDLEIAYEEKVPFVFFNTKVQKEKSLVWGKYELIKRFDKKQKYHEVNIYSKIKNGQRNTSLFSTAHMIVWINREDITISTLATVMRELNNNRCETPLPEHELIVICKKAMARINKKPAENRDYRYLFNSNAKLSHEDKMKLIGQERVKNNIYNFHALLDTWDISEKYSQKKAAEMIGLKPNTLRSWRTRFTELYGNADDKIRKIKQKHEELKDMDVEKLIGDVKAKCETNASWDNTDHPQFKRLAQESDTIEYALNLKNGVHQDGLQFNIDGFPWNYARMNELENIVFIDTASKLLLVRIGENTIWREDGLVVGIESLTFGIQPVLVGEIDRLSFTEEGFEEMINDPDLNLETKANWKNPNSKDFQKLLSINPKLIEVTHKARKLGHNKEYRVNYNGLNDKVRQKALEEGMDTVVLWEEEDTGLMFVPISDEVSWFEDGTLVGVNNFEGYPIPIAAGKRIH